MNAVGFVEKKPQLQATTGPVGYVHDTVDHVESLLIGVVSDLVAVHGENPEVEDSPPVVIESEETRALERRAMSSPQIEFVWTSMHQDTHGTVRMHIDILLSQLWLRVEDEEGVDLEWATLGLDVSGSVLWDLTFDEERAVRSVVFREFQDMDRDSAMWVERQFAANARHLGVYIRDIFTQLQDQRQFLDAGRARLPKGCSAAALFGVSEPRAQLLLDRWPGMALLDTSSTDGYDRELIIDDLQNFVSSFESHARALNEHLPLALELLRPPQERIWLRFAMKYDADGDRIAKAQLASCFQCPEVDSNTRHFVAHLEQALRGRDTPWNPLIDLLNGLRREGEFRDAGEETKAILWTIPDSEIEPIRHFDLA